MDWNKIVANLLAKAQDSAATAEERESYTERATYLMTKYSVEALIERPTNIPLNVEVIVLKVPNPYAKLRSILIHSTARAVGLRTVRDPRSKTVHVFGLPADLESFTNLYASLWIQALLGLATAQASKPVGEHGKTFNHSYLLGFINEVTARVRAAADRANQDSTSVAPSTALVLKNRSSAIDQKVEEIFPSLRSGTRTHANSSSGYFSGVAAGARADINQPRMGGSMTPRRALS